MDEEPVLLSFGDGIAIITLNRPESLNAASEAMMQALERQVRAAAQLPGLRVAILTAAGRAFCAGGDLLEFEWSLAAGGTKLIDTMRYNQDVIQMVEDMAVPVIAAVNGVAVAGGLELMLACDIILAAEEASIGDGHSRYGVVPTGGATVRLIERIGRSRASELFYTARLVEARTLAQWGLVNEVVPKARLMERSMELALEICRRSPETNRHIKSLPANATQAEARAAQIRAELRHFEQHMGGGDLAAGLAAFRTKQTPDF